LLTVTRVHGGVEGIDKAEFEQALVNRHAIEAN